MEKQIIAAIFEQGGRFLSGILQAYTIGRPRRPSVDLPSTQPEDDKRVTTDETIRYQQRQLAKELTLLEGHLVEGCRIDSKPCDCCEKHPIKIEGLAQETAGMTSEAVYRDIAQWAQDISPITTEAAAASGKYKDEYPKLAMQARAFRKAIMSPDIMKEVANDEDVPDGGDA